MVKENTFEGRYVLDKPGPCYRTQVALSAIIMHERRCLCYIAGPDDGKADQEKVDESLKTFLGKLSGQALKKMSEVEAVERQGKREDKHSVRC